MSEDEIYAFIAYNARVTRGTCHPGFQRSNLPDSPRTILNPHQGTTVYALDGTVIHPGEVFAVHRRTTLRADGK